MSDGEGFSTIVNPSTGTASLDTLIITSPKRGAGGRPRRIKKNFTLVPMVVVAGSREAVQGPRIDQVEIEFSVTGDASAPVAVAAGPVAVAAVVRKPVEVGDFIVKPFKDTQKSTVSTGAGVSVRRCGCGCGCGCSFSPRLLSPCSSDVLPPTLPTHFLS